LQPTPEVALALGQSEFELKRYRDAAEHLNFAIRSLDPTQNERALSPAKKALAEAIAQVAVLHVTTNRNEAEIRVDGTLVGKSPLDYPLYLNPGVHEISARSNSGGTARPISLEAGQESSLSLPIVTQATHPPSPWALGAPRIAPPQPEPVVTAPTRSLAPVIIGGAVFLAGITTGIVFRLDSDTQFSNADALRSRLANVGCQGDRSTQGDCAALANAVKNGDRSRNWSTAGFIFSAGALLGTAAYWFWPHSDTKAAAQNPMRIQLGAAILPQGSGLILTGDY